MGQRGELRGRKGRGTLCCWGNEIISSLLLAPKIKAKPGDAQPVSRCEPCVLVRLDFKKRLLLLLKRLSSFPTETPSVGCERTC